MKTVNSDDSHKTTYNSSKELLIDSKTDTEELQCDPQLIKSYNVLRSNPMGHKNYFYQRVLCKNGVSQSLPSSLDDKNETSPDNSNCCEAQSKLLSVKESPPVSPTHELWFKTWPERCDKLKTEHADSAVSDSVSNSNRIANDTTPHFTNGISNKVTLNEALQNISLAYSPVTKQLHLVEKISSKPAEEECVKKSGHKRTEAGSFSSTISSLSDPSPSGSLLDAEERSLQSYDENGEKCRKKSLGSFFTR